MSEFNVVAAHEYLETVHLTGNEIDVDFLVSYAANAYDAIVRGDKDAMEVVIKAVARAYEDGARDAYSDAAWRLREAKGNM